MHKPSTIRIIIYIALGFSALGAKPDKTWQLWNAWESKPAASGTSFAFPKASNPPQLYPQDHFAAYYVKRNPNTYPISGTFSVSYYIATTGTPVFNFTSEAWNAPSQGCAWPASVRPYFEDGFPGEFDRWWAVEPFSRVLAPGNQTIQVTIDPSNWSSVFGKKGTDSLEALAGFQKATSAVLGVGLTMSGGCTYGHGVDVIGGSAQFQLQDLYIR